jgi:hypothetical protein
MIAHCRSERQTNSMHVEAPEDEKFSPDPAIPLLESRLARLLPTTQRRELLEYST